MHTALRIALALACAAPPAVQAGGRPLAQIPTVIVSGPQTGTVHSATQGHVGSDQIGERPIARAGELLEFVPGLIVTQHSGEGKANQYFLRGFNLDHGTDFYSEVDGLPVNMRSHGHGQGYADINFIIPELIESIDYRKGPYYADVGDFATAGSARLRYVDALPSNLLRFTGGEHGYASVLAAGSPEVAGGRLLLGVEGSRYEGPYDLESDQQKLSGVARFNRGDAFNGITASLMGYDIDYLAPDQIPLRAVESGQIGRYGFIDPSDGGEVHRYSASLEWRRGDASQRWRVQGYALDYRMDLYSNFTYFLADPVNGDQFRQFDDRKVYGLEGSYRRALSWAVPLTLETGAQLRHDHIGTVGLYATRAREVVSTVREDGVRETSLGLHAGGTLQWTPWFASYLGLRADAYRFDVDAQLEANSGTENDTLVSPKLALVFGPWQRTRLFLNYGEGFHSNDARGVTIAVDPADGVTPLQAIDPLVKARGAELGVSSTPVEDLHLSAALWMLRSDSELVYVGDAGNSEASDASRRHGIELSAYWAPLPWLIVDADYAYSHARLDVSGNADRIPNSVEDTLSIGLTIPEMRGWSGGLRLRRLGGGPLIEDNSARSDSTTVVNLQLGYRLLDRFPLEVALLNAFDSTDNDITYFYESCLASEACGAGEANEGGVSDFHLHPVEPRAVRVTVGATF